MNFHQVAEGARVGGAQGRVQHKGTAECRQRVGEKASQADEVHLASSER